MSGAKSLLARLLVGAAAALLARGWDGDPESGMAAADLARVRDGLAGRKEAEEP